jgi:hypothetical protein
MSLLKKYKSHVIGFDLSVYILKRTEDAVNADSPAPGIQDARVHVATQNSFKAAKLPMG